MTPTTAAATEAAPQTATEPTAPETKRSAPRPITYGRKGNIEIAFLWFFVVVPFVAVIAAVPFAWGWGLSWADVAIFAVFYISPGSA